MLMIVATQATFLLNKERKVFYSAVYPRWNLAKQHCPSYSIIPKVLGEKCCEGRQNETCMLSSPRISHFE